MIADLLVLGIFAAALIAIAIGAATPPDTTFDAQNRERVGLDR